MPSIERTIALAMEHADVWKDATTETLTDPACAADALTAIKTMAKALRRADKFVGHVMSGDVIKVRQMIRDY